VDSNAVFSTINYFDGILFLQKCKNAQKFKNSNNSLLDLISKTTAIITITSNNKELKKISSLTIEKKKKQKKKNLKFSKKMSTTEVDNDNSNDVSFKFDLKQLVNVATVRKQEFKKKKRFLIKTFTNTLLYSSYDYYLLSVLNLVKINLVELVKLLIEHGIVIQKK
jgi:hypothetical protein